MEARMHPHQREARRTGRPSLGSGAVYPVPDKELLVDPVRIPDHFGRGYGFDVGWNVTAALFAAHDPETDVFYLTAEYRSEKAEPAVHASAIRAMQPYPLIGAIDPAAEGSSQMDGTNLREEYEGMGLRLTPANNAVVAGVHHCLILMQERRLRVFRTLEHWLREFRLYQRDEKGKIVKQHDHLMDCMRYVLNTSGVLRPKPAQGPLIKRRYGEW